MQLISYYVMYFIIYFTANALKKKNQMIPYINNVNMWGQNLEGYFKDAIETKSINDWMISVSPSVSYEYVF